MSAGYPKASGNNRTLVVVILQWRWACLRVEQRSRSLVKMRERSADSWIERTPDERLSVNY